MKRRKLNPLGSCRLPIPELSGLAFHPQRNTLFAVGDDAGSVYEIDLGEPPRVLARTRLKKGRRHDIEGITVDPRDDTLLVASEAEGQILRYDLAGELVATHDVDVRAKGKSGLEGLSVDPTSFHLFAVHERKPRRVLELDPSFAVIDESKLEGLRDLSGVCVHDGSLWVVSDESEALCKLKRDSDGWQIDTRWNLERPSAEGIAIVGERFYVGFDTPKGDNLVWYASG